MIVYFVDVAECDRDNRNECDFDIRSIYCI